MPIIPDRDSQFDAWQDAAYGAVSGNLVAYGLDAADLAPLTAAKADWDSAFPAAVAAKAAAKAAVAAKRGSKDAYESAWRAIIGRIYADPTVEPSALEAAGLPVRDRTRTRVRVPVSAPLLQLDFSERLRHAVRFMDSEAHGTRARPEGSIGCELRVFVGQEAPTDLGQFDFMGLSTRSPFRHEFEAEEAGLAAHWIGRWVNRRGEPGPWSRTVSAVVPG